MIQIRRLLHSDRTIYRQTRLECLKNFPQNFGSSYAEESHREQLFFEGILIQKLEYPFIYGAFAGDNCIGLCGFVRESKQRTRHRGDLVQVYINRDYQGRGIGKQLLKTVINAAFALSGMEQIGLGVAANNIAAIRTYKQLGFAEYGLLKKYFKEEDGYLDQSLMILTKTQWNAR